MFSKRQFDQIFDDHVHSVAALLRYYTTDKNKLEDWVQDVFIKVWEARDKIDPDHSGLGGYILKIARNHAIYKLKRETKRPFVDKEIPQQIKDRRNNVKENIAKKELTSAYLKALQKVPPRAREAFALSRDEHMTYKEIAKSMNISTKTVEGQISKTLRILRSELKEHIA